MMVELKSHFSSTAEISMNDLPQKGFATASYKCTQYRLWKFQQRGRLTNSMYPEQGVDLCAPGIIVLSRQKPTARMSPPSFSHFMVYDRLIWAIEPFYHGLKLRFYRTVSYGHTPRV